MDVDFADFGLDEREQKILDELPEDGAELSELAESLDMSEEEISEGLLELQREGRVYRQSRVYRKIE